MRFSLGQHLAYLSLPVYLLIFGELAGTEMQEKRFGEISTSFVLAALHCFCGNPPTPIADSTFILNTCFLFFCIIDVK